MKKDSINILISLGVLVFTFFILGLTIWLVYLSYNPPEGNPEIFFFAREDRGVEGGEVISYCEIYECEYSWDTLDENKLYDTIDFYMVNKGKRTHNLLIDIDCHPIWFVAFNKELSNSEVVRFSRLGVELKFEETNSINIETWKLIYENQNYTEITCRVNYLSNELRARSILLEVELCGDMCNETNKDIVVYPSLD